MTEHAPSSRWSRVLASVGRSANTILAVAFLYVVIMLTVTLWQFWPPSRVIPVTTATIELLSTEPAAGGRLPIRLTMNKVRVCNVEDTHLILDDTGLVVARLPSTGQLFPLGRTSRIIVHEIPDDLPPGDYVFELMLLYECRWPVGTYLVIPDGNHAFTISPR